MVFALRAAASVPSVRAGPDAAHQSNGCGERVLNPAQRRGSHLTEANERIGSPRWRYISF
jgi:hypothetical protein